MHPPFAPFLPSAHAVPPADSISTTLDGVGNRTGQTVGGTSSTFTCSDDELTATTGGMVNSYAYDALGRRYSRTVNGGTPTVFYYANGQIVREKQGANWTAMYTYGIGLVRKSLH